MELPSHQEQQQHTPAVTTTMNGHHQQQLPTHHHRQASSNGGSGVHPSEKTALMQQARSAYRLNDIEASRCVRGQWRRRG